MRIPDVSLRSIRAVVTTVVVLDLLLLLTFAFHRSVRTTATVTSLASVPTSPASALTSASTPGPSLTPGAAAPPLASPAVAVLPVVDAATSSASSTTRSVPAPEPSATTTAAACPIPLAPPARTGGLQSLIDFAPAFGPFSAEAFAAASAYQPMLHLLGPVLVQYPAYAAELQPVLDPLLHQFADLLDTGFTLISPIYSPHRQQVLQYETKIAAALAPYAQKLASSELGSCLVDVEAALVNDTK